MAGVFLAPENLWWLIRHNRPDDAKAALRRLTSPKNAELDIDKNVAVIALTTEHEREVNGNTRLIACFRGTDLRRTSIIIGCYCMQILSGSILRAFATYFLQQAGLPTSQAFNKTIVA